jgi:D-glycero-alpha-D-manno-heptose-7-phosphate kinase
MKPSPENGPEPKTLTVRASAPTRVDLAGGTLDLWPVAHILRARFGHTLPTARTINFGLEKRTSCELELSRTSRSATSRLVLTLSDEAHTQTFEYPREDQPMRSGFPLLASVIEEFAPACVAKGWTEVRVGTCSDVPRGSGLGGSSSLYITLLTAFDQALNEGKKADLFDTCQQACNLEAGLLGGLAGTQDHLGAAFGGISAFSFHSDRIHRTALPVSGLQWLAENCILAMAPEVHHSGQANARLMRAFLDKDDQAVHVFRAITENTAELQTALEAENFLTVPALIAKDWDLRRMAFPEISTPSLEHIRDLALSTGARAVKVCGAAAGGMALVVHAGQPQGERSIYAALAANGYLGIAVEPARSGVTCEMVKMV